MDIEQIVFELKSAIRNKDELKVQNLIGPIRDIAVIKVIDEQFYSIVVDSSDNQIDPINYAIEFRSEKIAIYLVEKSFPTHRLYQQESLQCDQWCYFDHGNDRCPAEWDAADNAGYAGFYNLKNLIEGIRTGKRKPGEGLTSPFIQDSNKSEKMEPVKQEKQGIPIYQVQKAKDVEDARKILDDYGKNYVSKDGNTLFHCYITKPKVYFYVFAAGGVPVNIQNSNGDTALHMAVQTGSVDAAEALLQCCADPTVRNKMGQTPLDMSDNEGITKLINKFKPGVVFSVCNDKAQTLDRVLKNTWCCLESVVKEGKTAIELAECKMFEGKSEKCLNVLKSYRKTSQLILAVLCHDVETTRKLLDREQLPVNIRFRDRLGKTLLSHCIEQRNLELVKLLVEHGARVNQIRVRQDEETDVTVPLFHKCLCDNECLDIAKYLNPLMDPSEHKEKDQAGNTPLLAAIEKGLSVRYIQWLIQATRGFALVDRNSDGLTAKELAISKGNTEVVKVIDKFILKSVNSETGVPTLLPQFAINFSREEDITGIIDESSMKSLIELLQDNDKYNLKKWLNFNDVCAYANRVMKAASGDGGLTVVQKLYDAHYRDRNGFTAMTRAVVFQQYDIIEYLCTTRPALKTLPDNNNRYPLHYAFALPEPESKKIRDLLLEKNPQDQEKRVDKDGLYPADYAPMRDSLKTMKMLYDARTLNVFAQRGPPLGRWPVGAKKDYPDEE